MITQQTTLLFTFIYGIFAFLITLYGLYLNYRQAKVNTQMNELIAETKLIRQILQNKK